jgi:hypothetical protein
VFFGENEAQGSSSSAGIIDPPRKATEYVVKIELPEHATQGQWEVRIGKLDLTMHYLLVPCYLPDRLSVPC